MRNFVTIVLLAAGVMMTGAIDKMGPTMGWSSWNTYRVHISDSLIVSQAQAMVDLGLDTVGYRYVNIDDGFQGGRDPETGGLLVNPHRFPNGLRPVVDAIHNLGLKAGTYTDAGLNTCGNFNDKDTLSVNVGLYGHEEQDCKYYFDELNFDFIKIDYCGAIPISNFQHLSLDPETQYRRISQAIKSTARGDSVRVNVCRWDYPGTWVSDVSTSWRISGDIWCEWSRVKEIIDQSLYLSAYARDGHYNDMDMLEVGRTLTPIEDETHFAIWCMMSSPLLIGCDMTTLRPETLALLSNKELVAINQDSLHQQAVVIKADPNGGYVLARDLEKLYGLKRAIAFYNPTDSDISISITLKELELEGPVDGRDAIKQCDLDSIGNELSVRMQPHQTKVFTLVGSKRLSREVYEAETAWLGAYQELYNPLAVGTAYYLRDNRLSGGVGVANAGITPVNEIVWDQINVNTDGVYDIEITYLPTAGSGAFYVNANGNDCELVTPVEAGDNPELSTLSVKKHLKKGLNRVSMYGCERIPVIDKITIK